MQEFLFTYEHNGHKWDFSVHADDYDDARARLRKLTSATYLGVVQARIPAALGGGSIARLYCTIANFFRSKP